MKKGNKFDWFRHCLPLQCCGDTFLIWYVVSYVDEQLGQLIDFLMSCNGRGMCGRGMIEGRCTLDANLDEGVLKYEQLVKDISGQINVDLLDGQADREAWQLAWGKGPDITNKVDGRKGNSPDGQFILVLLRYANHDTKL